MFRTDVQTPLLSPRQLTLAKGNRQRGVRLLSVKKEAKRIKGKYHDLLEARPGSHIPQETSKIQIE